MYSSEVKRLTATLPNRGDLPNATHRAQGENPVCGDRIAFTIEIAEGLLKECRFTATGCPAAIASAAAVTELVTGRNVSACLALDSADLLEYLGGLPAHKHHGAELAVSVLRRALARPLER